MSRVFNAYVIHHFSSTNSFYVVNFWVKFEVILEKQLLSVAANHLKSGFIEQQSVFHKNSLGYTTVEEVNSTEIDSHFS